MTDPHRHAVAAVAACLAAGLLLAACSKSTPAAQTTSAVQTRAAATDATSVAATNAASAQATTAATATDTTSAAAPTGTSGAANAHPGSACALVTIDEVTAAAGKTMHMTGDGGNICAFSAVDDPSFLIYLQIYGDVSSMALLKEVEPGSEHLAGLGDDAFWNATTGTVFVQTGTRAFSVVSPSLSGTPDAIKAKMLTLAKAALGRF
jgi:hypothetical protein